MGSTYSEIREGMDVLDLAGDKIGTVDRVVGQWTMANVGQEGEGVGRDMEAKRAGKGATGHIEVHYQGQVLAIPFSAVNEVREDAVTIIVDKESVPRQGWDRASRRA